MDTNLSDQLCVMLESSEVKNFDPSPVLDLWNSTPRRPCSALDIYESSLSTSARLPGSPSKVQSAEPITPKTSDHVQVLNCRNSAEIIVSVDEELVEVLHVGDDKQEKKDANNNVEEIMSVSSDLNTVSSQAIMPLSVANDLSSSQVSVISNLSSSQLSTPVSVSSGNLNLSIMSTNEIGVDTADLFWGVNKGVNTEESVSSVEGPCKEYESDDYISEHADNTDYEPVASYTDRLKLAADAYSEFCSSLDFFECRVSV